MSGSAPRAVDLACPVPADHDVATMAHGGGGRLMARLIDRLRPLLGATHDNGHDGAIIPFGDRRIALTTDTFVVDPLFFPGGDIGTLAVNGTVNDLAMCGATPQAITCALVIEEGLPLDVLDRVAASMRSAADAAGVDIVTGDTKLVERGKGDGLFINTAGIGDVPDGIDIGPHRIRSGDAVLLSGDIGRHGMAIMAQREGLAFEDTIDSDCAPLHRHAADLTAAGTVHCMRDLTRGGLASALVELATAAGKQIDIDGDVPVADPVRGACEVLGLDPWYVANEGRCIAIVPEADADTALDALRDHDPHACRIGSVADGPGRVVAHHAIGGRRVVDLLSGEQLPRIC